MRRSLREGFTRAVRRPLLTLAVVLPLAVATAVTTALFNLVDGIYLRPLPLDNTDRVVAVRVPPRQTDRLSALVTVLASPQTRDEYVRAFRQSPLFATTVAASPGWGFHVRVAWEIQLSAAAVDVHFFDTFGLEPAMGRVFTVDDQAIADAAQPADLLPVVISDRYWRSVFGGSSDIVGTSTTIAERPVVVVGVMPPGVKFPKDTDVWTPRARGPLAQLQGFAHLAPGVTIEQARQAFPLLDFVGVRESLIPKEGTALVFIFGTGLTLLLLAGTQVSGLLLTSATDRIHEMRVRLSLGAGRRQMAAQFAGEAAWLTVGAFLLSLPGIPVLTNLITTLLPAELTATSYVDLSWRAYAFAALAVTAGFALLTLSPLVVIRRLTPFWQSQPSQTHARTSGPVRQRVLIAQIACTSFLLYIASLSAYSYLNVLTFNFGFDAENVVIIYPERQGPFSVDAFMAHVARVADAAEPLKALPFVRFATPVMDSPLRDPVDTLMEGTINRLRGLSIAPITAREFSGGVDVIEALGAQVLAGTTFLDPEYRSRIDVVVINESLARKLSPLVPPIGQRIGGRYLDAVIIGIVRDLVDSKPEVPAAPLVIRRAGDRSTLQHRLLVRTTSPASAHLPALRSFIEDTFGPTRPTQLRLLADDVDTTRHPWRGRAAVLSLVASIGIPLAAVGLASALFFMVRTRTRELGIRMALGASPAQARMTVLASARRVAIAGGVIGTLAGVVAGRGMGSQLFGVTAASPVAVMAVALLLATIMGLASYLPARQVSKIDPALALRRE